MATIRSLVLVVVALLSCVNTYAACIGKPCDTCLTTAGCGFCQGSISSSCVDIPSGTPADKCPGLFPGTYSTSVRLTSCPAAVNPCSPNPCTTAPNTKCNVNPLVMAGYSCSDPCFGFLCGIGEKCSSTTGTPTCVSACNPACSGMQFCLCGLTGTCSCNADQCGGCTGGQTCQATLTASGFSWGCACPVGMVLTQGMSGSTCQAPPALDLCNPSPCAFAGQVCSLSTALGSLIAAPVCNCPLGLVLGFTGSTSITPDGLQLTSKACLADPCLSITCGGDQTCIASSSVLGAVANLVATCVCKPGFKLLNGNCVTDVITCPGVQVKDLLTGKCVNLCPDGLTTPTNNKCPFACPAGQLPNPFTQSGCGVLCPDRSWAEDLLRCPCLLSPPAPLDVVGAIAYRLCCNITKFEVPNVLAGFPGSLSNPINQGCIQCPCAALGNCANLPINGICPGSIGGGGTNPLNLCPPGWQADPTNNGKCRFNCNISALVPTIKDFPDLCPILCAVGQVLDAGSRQCVSPCPDLSIPFNGKCQSLCPPSFTQFQCCVLQGGTNCVEQCPFGFVPLAPLDILSNLTCIEACDNGLPRDPITKKCNDDDSQPLCAQGATKDLTSGLCKYPCPPTTANPMRVAKINPLDCCQLPAVFDVFNLVCRCPDGSRANDDGSCNMPCNPVLDLDCPCPKPLVRNAMTKLCLCPDGSLLKDGGCLSAPIECASGLVQSAAAGTCLCPDGQAPVGDRCPCNPAEDKNCPVTPFNCQISGVALVLPACLCVLQISAAHTDTSASVTASIIDPMCLQSGQSALTSVTLTLDYCLANPARTGCFCIMNPDSTDCKRPNPCLDLTYAAANPTICINPPLCIPGSSTSFCPLDKYCSIAEKLNLSRCDCLRDPIKCAFNQPPLLPLDCRDHEGVDPSYLGCVCHFGLHSLCFDQNGDPQGDKGGVGGPSGPGTGTGAPITAHNATGLCGNGNCTKEIRRVVDLLSGGSLFNLTDVLHGIDAAGLLRSVNPNQLTNLSAIAESLHLPDAKNAKLEDVLQALNITDALPLDIQDLVNIQVINCGEISFSRVASAVSHWNGASGVARAAINNITHAALSNVTTFFRMALSKLTEFADLNDNGILDDGDLVRSLVDVSKLVCNITRTPVTVDQQQCDTVTVFDATNILSLTFTICSPQLNIGKRVVPPRSAFQVVQVHYSFQFPDSKLALSFDAFSKEAGDVFAFNVGLGQLSLSTLGGYGKGFLNFDTTARAADSQVPLHFGLTDTSALAAIAVGRASDELNSARLTITADTFSPSTLVMNPQYSVPGTGTGFSAQPLSTEPSSGSSGLSGGAIAGIVIGSVAAVGILVGGAVYLSSAKAAKSAAYAAPNAQNPPSAGV